MRNLGSEIALVRSPQRSYRNQIHILKFDPHVTKYLGSRFSLSITRIGLILLGIAMIAIGLWMKVEIIHIRTSQTWIAILAGLSLILAGLRPGDPSLSKKSNKIEQILCTWLGVKSWQLDALIAGIALSLLTWLSAGYGQKMILPWIAVAGWIGGMACVLFGGWPGAFKPVRVPRVELWLIAGLFIAAFFFAP